MFVLSNLWLNMFVYHTFLHNVALTQTAVQKPIEEKVKLPVTSSIRSHLVFSPSCSQCRTLSAPIAPPLPRMRQNMILSGSQFLALHGYMVIQLPVGSWRRKLRVRRRGASERVKTKRERWRKYNKGGRQHIQICTYYNCCAEQHLEIQWGIVCLILCVHS